MKRMMWKEFAQMPIGTVYYRSHDYLNEKDLIELAVKQETIYDDNKKPIDFKRIPLYPCNYSDEPAPIFDPEKDVEWSKGTKDIEYGFVIYEKDEVELLIRILNYSLVKL